MTEHLDDDQVIAAAGRPSEHAESCAECRRKIDAWRVLALAADRAREPLVVPSFDLLAAKLNPARLTAPRWAGELVIAQMRLLPRSLWPLTAALLAIAGWTAGLVNAAQAPATVGAGTTLVAVLAAACVVRRESDPRAEITAVVPAGPTIVLTARLLLVSAVTVAGGLLVSLVLALARQDIALPSLVLAWIGPVALALSLTLFAGLAAGPAVGVLCGAGLWAVATVSALSPAAAANSPLLRVWSTGPLTLGCAALLIGASLVGVNFFRVRTHD